MHRAEPHFGWIECAPLRIDNRAEWFQIVFYDGFLRSQNQHRRAIGHLRGIARRHTAVNLVEHRAQLGEALRCGIGAHAIVVLVNIAGGIDQRLDFIEVFCFTAREHPQMRVGGEGVHRFARDAKTLGDNFRCLPHGQLDDGISEAF